MRQFHPLSKMTKTTQFGGSLGFPSIQQQQQGVPVDTPTIVDKLAQWLQAEKCQEMHESYERTGNVEALAIPSAAAPISDNTSYISCSNKNALQGGTITINPTTFVRLTDFDQDTDKIPVVVNEVIEEQKLPLPVVQTNRKRTMVTRSLSRQVSEVTNNNIKEEMEDNDPDYTPDSPVESRAPPPAKKSRRSVAGRKPKSTRGDDLDDLPPEEQDKVRSRRQKNKEAAARCRQKRVDLTNKLSKEVEEHQAIKVRLEQEIKKLRMEQENLRRVLENHQAYGCRLQMPNNMQIQDNSNQIYVAAPPQPQSRPQQQDTKPFAVAIKSAPVIVEAADAPYVLPDVTTVPEHQPLTKPTRPQTLTIGVGGSLSLKPDKAFIRDEELETPSKIVANLFEQSGFTPTSIFGNIPSLNTPTCSVQQRSSEMAVMTSTELNTPCNDTGAISLTAL